MDERDETERNVLKSFSQFKLETKLAKFSKLIAPNNENFKLDVDGAFANYNFKSMADNGGTYFLVFENEDNGTKLVYHTDGKIFERFDVSSFSEPTPEISRIKYFNNGQASIIENIDPFKFSEYIARRLERYAERGTVENPERLEALVEFYNNMNKPQEQGNEAFIN